MELNWSNSYDGAFQQEPVRTVNYQPTTNTPTQTQTTQQLMPNVYQPNIPEEPYIEHFTQEGDNSLKKYIELFVIIVLVYFILSLDSVKDTIGRIITCINVQEDGSICKLGFVCYGIVLGICVCGLTYIIDNYITINF